MAYVFRPVKPPPKLSQYHTLSVEAQKTLAALEEKYERLLSYLQTPVARQHDPTNYYKNIYQASFKKSLNATYSERDQEESCTKSYDDSSIEKPLQFTSDNFLDINSISHMPRKRKQLYKKDSMFEKKNGRMKPATEVFLDHHPSDEEIAESVLSLTQRTSHPDSPCMDLDLVEFQSQDESILKSLVQRDYKVGNAVVTSCFSQSTGVFNSSESQENNGKQGTYYDPLCQPTLGISPLNTYIEANEITDLNLLMDGVFHEVQNQSHASWSLLDHNCKSSTNSDILSASKEDVILGDGKHSLSESRRNNHQELLPCLSETVDFELKFSGSEFSQISHNSQSNFNGLKEIAESCLVESCSTRCKLKENESPFDKKQKTLQNILSISENDESPFDEGNLKHESSCLVMMNEAKKCDKEIVSTTLKNSTTVTCENESPYMVDTDAIQINKLKSHKKLSIAKHCKIKVSECGAQQRIDDFFQIDSCKNGNTNKDDIQLQKRIGEHYGKPYAKKVKSSFKPPYKAQLEDSGEHLDASLHSLPDVINLSSLSSEKQKETFSLWETSQSLALTLLYNTNLTSAATFYSAADQAKKKNSGLQPQTVGIVILEVNSTGRCFLIPSDLICRDDVKKALLNIMLAKKITKIIANCKEFLIGIHKLYSLNSERGMLCQNLEDPVIACWLVDPDNQPSSFAQMCKTANLQHRYNEKSWAACLQFTPKLMQAFRQRLKKDKLWSVFTQIEMKLIPILACMETHTIKVDTELFVKFSDILKIKIKKLEEAIYKEAGHKFSLNSHVQLRQVLYEELELEKKLAPEVKIGKTDVYNQKSTCESSLNLLAVVHPLPALVMEYRQKLMSTYVDGMMSCVTNGSLMTHWDQTAAATGRLTSSQPNIQAVPKTVITITDIHTTYVSGSQKISSVDINAREPFISNHGYVFLAADFQQIELRVLAHLSGDSSLQILFRKSHSEDIFMSLTKQWHKKVTEEVTLAEREQTKRVVYSVMYGVGKDKLSEYMKVTSDIAQDIITSFLQQFPAIESFTKKCWMYAQEFGYTETVSGRRRYFPHINSTSPVLRAQARRQAVNFCVQGSAADICKLAMLAVESKFKEYSHLSCRLLLQIHDELIWEVPETQLLETKGVIQQVMEDTKAVCSTLFSLQVPLTVALSSGKSWAHLNPLV